MKEGLVIVARRNEPKLRCKKPCCSDQKECISVMMQ